MVITCPKCQHANQAATGQAMETCPQCCVIYARAAVQQLQQRQAEAVRSRVAASTPAGNAPGFVERLGWYLTIACALYCVVPRSRRPARAWPRLPPWSSPTAWPEPCSSCSGAGAGIGPAMLGAAPFCAKRRCDR